MSSVERAWLDGAGLHFRTVREKGGGLGGAPTLHGTGIQ